LRSKVVRFFSTVTQNKKSDFEGYTKKQERPEKQIGPLPYPFEETHKSIYPLKESHGKRGR